jgi:hypothetical protein
MEKNGKMNKKYLVTYYIGDDAQGEEFENYKNALAYYSSTCESFKKEWRDWCFSGSKYKELAVVLEKITVDEDENIIDSKCIYHKNFIYRKYKGTATA